MIKTPDDCAFDPFPCRLTHTDAQYSWRYRYYDRQTHKLVIRGPRTASKSSKLGKRKAVDVPKSDSEDQLAPKKKAVIVSDEASDSDDDVPLAKAVVPSSDEEDEQSANSDDE